MRKSKIVNMKWIATSMMCCMLFGAFVPEDKAIEVARNIYLEHEDLHSGIEFSISSVERIKEKGNILIYIFHLDPTGFIMVPADNQAVPNLAFGFDHPFNSNNMPSNLQALMDHYAKELRILTSSDGSPDVDRKAHWDRYINGNITLNRSRDVSPLIDAEFDQSGSWNNGVTSAIGFNGPVGCVAVAMVQVMH